MTTDADDDEFPYSAITDGVSVDVMPIFVDEQSDPQRGRYFWAYRVRIANFSELSVQLMTRHWIITDGHGRIEEVKGDGVVGEQPMLDPGEAFEYTSGCPLGTPSGFMRGSYQMIDQTGRSFDAQIPVFSLDSPYGSGMIN
jgi:ApaG protein